MSDHWMMDDDDGDIDDDEDDDDDDDDVKRVRAKVFISGCMGGGVGGC